MSVLLVAEHNNKELRPFTLNAVTAAVQIDSDLHVLVMVHFQRDIFLVFDKLMHDPDTINGHPGEELKEYFFVIHETKEFSVFQFFRWIVFLKLPAHVHQIVKTLP